MKTSLGRDAGPDQRWLERGSVEVAMAHRLAIGASEDEGVRVRSYRRGQVNLEVGQEGFGDWDRPALICFRGAEDEITPDIGK
jgi:uncharacterized phage protein gp47/JayE